MRRLSAGVAFDISDNERRRKPIRYAGDSYGWHSPKIQAYQGMCGAGMIAADVRTPPKNMNQEV